MRQFPVLRAGKPYQSVDRVPVQHFLTGEVMGELSMANSGMIPWDIRHKREWSQRLSSIGIAQWESIFTRAANAFECDVLGAFDQSFEDYLDQLSATTGMPLTLCRKNAAKISAALREIRPTLQGLMRGMDPSQLEDSRGGVMFRREAACMGAVLPSNSPGVHSLWLPAIALKVPVVLKPGRQEPWSPYRIAAALIESGCPPEAVSIYPTDHAGAREILMNTDRSMLFGDERTVSPWRGDARVQIHGPGWSKVLVGEDMGEEVLAFVDLIERSVCENSGRSCLNTSSVWTATHGYELADGLAKRLGAINALPLNHPQATLSAFAQPEVAKLFSKMVDELLQTPGAEDMTAKYREGGRVAVVDGAHFLLPTVVWCSDPDHPLMQMEFLFPFVAVTQVPQGDLLNHLQETLVATALTRDEQWINQLKVAHQIDRLNIGPIPTFHIRRDQPHEGNLFEFLYQQRAYQEERQF